MSDNFDKIWSRFKADLIAQRGGVTRPVQRITNSDPGDEQPDPVAELAQEMNLKLENDENRQL